MKSHTLRNLHVVIGNVSLAFLLLLGFAVCLASIPAHAQGDIWHVDPQHSIARLSLGSASNALEIGLARISGEVVFDSNDPADPSVNLKVTPDNGPSAEYAEMSFTSSRSTMTRGGELVITGELSVTRIERNVAAEPNEAYAGPQYGDPVTITDTRQITLVFPDPSPLTARNGVMQLSGATSVRREAFPQLLNALTLDAWPIQFVNDEKCSAPSTIGEDYSGVKCTGTVIATVTNSVVMVGSAGGEDYSGFQPVVTPDRDQATVAVDLKLAQLAPTSPVASGASASAGH